MGRSKRIDRAVLAGLFSLALAGPAAAVELAVSDDHPKQGQTIEVTVRDAPATSEQPVTVLFNKHHYRLFATASQRQAMGKQPPLVAMAESNTASDVMPSVGDDQAGCAAEAIKYRVEQGAAVLSALIAIPADLAPGTYSLRAGQATKRIVVVSGHFPVQRLRLRKETAELKPAPGEAESVALAKATISPKRMWMGRFTRPAKARVTAGFGLRRVVNGKLLTDYFHSGIDYAAPLGTPVKATAPGKVILAATGFRLHGNTVCIDHGQGVVSFYIHLQKVLVKPGQIVAAGETIGKVGQSGRASGPHLHFGIYVQEVAANPVYWLSQSF